MPHLALELLDLISDFVIADDDSATIQACSLVFRWNTTRFQRALCLKNPAIFSFFPGTDEDPAQQKMFESLFEILDANPGFGACLSEVRFQFQGKKSPSDPRVERIARHCTKVFILGIRFLEGGQWDELTEANRSALSAIIQFPNLKTLELSSVRVSWSTFLHPRPFLESLILNGDCHATTFNPLFPRNTFLTPARIENLTGSAIVLRRLVDAQLGGTSSESFAVDIGRLRTLSTYYLQREVTNLRHVLLRADQLETLSISTKYFTSLAGLFQQPHPLCVATLRHLILRSKTYMASATFQVLVEELGCFSGNNVLTTFAVEIRVPGYSRRSSGPALATKEDILALLAPLGRGVFPCLQSVSVTVWVSVVNGQEIASQLKVQQLKVRKEELEAMEWDFVFTMNVKERFSYV